MPEASQSGGFVKLAPGVYVGPDDSLHLVLPELLEAHGLEATPENIERMTKAGQYLAGPGVTVEVEP